MHNLELAGLFVLATIIAGVAAGVIYGLTTYFRVRTIGKLNKTMGGRSYLLLTGSPEGVKQAYDICIAVLNRVEAVQTNKSEAQIGIADDEPTEPAPSTEETTEKKTPRS